MGNEEMTNKALELIIKAIIQIIKDNYNKEIIIKKIEDLIK